MKKLLFIILSAVFFLGCDRDENKTIELIEGTPTTQKVYANETLKTNAIKFSAKENWQVSIHFNETDSEWLKLDKYKGEAGNHRLSLRLTENKTGVARHAEIRIDCGGKSVSISIEQTNTERSEEPNTPQFERYVKKIRMESDDYNQEYTFEYTKDMRISSILTTAFFDDNIQKLLIKLEYKENKIIGALYDANSEIHTPAGETFEISLNTKGYAERVIMLRETTIDPETYKRLYSNKAEVKLTTEYSYDANGFLIQGAKYVENREEETRQDYTLTWSNENLYKIFWTTKWEDNASSPYDIISYSNYLHNRSCNLDVNVFFAGTEGYSSFFPLSGLFHLNGNSSKNLPEIATSWRYNNNDREMQESYRINYTYVLDQKGYINECQTIRTSNDVMYNSNSGDNSSRTKYTVEYVAN